MRQRRRLVIYVGYDQSSIDLLRRVMVFKSFFDDVTVIHVPEVKKSVLNNLEIPCVVVEDIQA